MNADETDTSHRLAAGNRKWEHERSAKRHRRNMNPDLNRKAREDVNRKIKRNYRRKIRNHGQFAEPGIGYDATEAGKSGKNVYTEEEGSNFGQKIEYGSMPEHPFIKAFEKRKTELDAKNKSREEMLERIAESKRRRNKKHRSMSKKTKKGQPVFAPIIKNYLSQIEQQIAAEKKDKDNE